MKKEPIVEIHTTDNRGFTPEEVAKRCVDKIVEVGDNAPPVIRDQARAFKRSFRESYSVLHERSYKL